MEEDKCCYCSYRGKILKTSTIKACGKSAVEFTDNIRNYTYMAILYRIKILSIRSMKINDQFNCRKKSPEKKAVTSITLTFPFGGNIRLRT